MKALQIFTQSFQDKGKENLVWNEKSWTFFQHQGKDFTENLLELCKYFFTVKFSIDKNKFEIP